MDGIHEKIKIAESKRQRILASESLYRKIEYFLKELKEYVIKTEEERISIGMASICASCAKSSIPCCGSGIEIKYSPELLTINLLYGQKFPEKPEIDNMCFFLTERGCGLFARDVFCMNFICEKIRKKLTPDKLRKLRDLEGKQLELQFRIEELIKSV